MRIGAVHCTMEPHAGLHCRRARCALHVMASTQQPCGPVVSCSRACWPGPRPGLVPRAPWRCGKTGWPASPRPHTAHGIPLRPRRHFNEPSCLFRHRSRLPSHCRGSPPPPPPNLPHTPLTCLTPPPSLRPRPIYLGLVGLSSLTARSGGCCVGRRGHVVPGTLGNARPWNNKSRRSVKGESTGTGSASAPGPRTVPRRPANFAAVRASHVNFRRRIAPRARERVSCLCGWLAVAPRRHFQSHRGRAASARPGRHTHAVTPRLPGLPFGDIASGAPHPRERVAEEAL